MFSCSWKYWAVLSLSLLYPHILLRLISCKFLLLFSIEAFSVTQVIEYVYQTTFSKCQSVFTKLILAFSLSPLTTTFLVFNTLSRFLFPVHSLSHSFPVHSLSRSLPVHSLSRLLIHSVHSLSHSLSRFLSHFLASLFSFAQFLSLYFASLEPYYCASKHYYPYSLSMFFQSLYSDSIKVLARLLSFQCFYAPGLVHALSLSLCLWEHSFNVPSLQFWSLLVSSN